MIESVTLRGGVEGQSIEDVVLPVEGHVTAILVETDDVVGSGDALVAVDGQPVLIFPAGFPAWRTIVVGDSGPDVDALKEALGTTAGAWNSDDVAAVDALLEPYGASLAPLEDTVSRVDEATDAVEDAEHSVTRAERALQRAVEARAELADAAREELADARGDYEAIDRESAEQVRTAEAELTAAQAASDSTSQGDDDGADAEDDASLISAAEERVQAAKDDRKDQLEAARQQIEVANKSVEDAQDAPLDAERDSVADAERGLDRARQELERAQVAASPIMPVGAYLFVPDLPARVLTVPDVGVPTSDEALMRLTSETMVFRGLAGSAAPIEVGDDASVGEGDSTVAGRVAHLGAETADGEVPVTIESVDGVELPHDADIAGIVVAQTEEVLAVPTAAVWTDASGQAFVNSTGSDGRRVAVEVGRTVGGWVELTSSEGLSEGDEVRTGVWVGQSDDRGSRND